MVSFLLDCILKLAEYVVRANQCIYDKEGNLVFDDGASPSTSSTSTTSDAPVSGGLEDICHLASCLRSGLSQMDLDITSDAVPHADLNKSLLRIVLSGCVATSVYLPDDLSSVYVAQVRAVSWLRVLSLTFFITYS